ncbi:DUF6744 family protein [Sporosarcina sp. E16_8]|uniref:DUF6744 family protein n=1 Tax=Sporosarcina sp. E16_8 TaxID=2789295 RepID=UPI001A90FFEB|nr:DUF6744 family protein [Sporosarcina sp. E16_8]MBO0587737.1 hypothetical protein [Sporosarcina sp. E16_8]
MSINLDNMTAVQNKQQDGILGHLMWFSVGKQLVKMDDLERGLVQSGLPVEWMPNAIRPADAFRRSTKEIETRKSTGHAGVFENFLIREVFSDKSHVQRNIVVETVNQSGKRLDYNSQAGIITLDKHKSSLTFITENEIAKELCFEAERNFNIYKDHYSAQQIRVMVSKILQSLAPTPVRPNGGVYFVPDSHTEGLKQLVNFTSSLENSEGFKIPVVNTFDNRQMVNTKLNDHLELILIDCKSSSRLKKGQVKEIIENAKSVIANYRNYKGIVANEAEALENKIISIRAAVTKMVADL